MYFVGVIIKSRGRNVDYRGERPTKNFYIPYAMSRWENEEDSSLGQKKRKRDSRAFRDSLI